MQIWQKHQKPNRPKYARENHPFLMALMEKFSISYRLGDFPAQASRSLIPQLIRNDRPLKGKQMPWLPGDELDDRPEASLSCVLAEDPPPGLVPLMIARTHHLSCEDQHWIAGAFLKHEVFGEAHMQLVDRELRFVARGNYPPHLLGVLSDTAGRLLKEWEGIHWELSVPCTTCPTALPADRPRGNFPVEAIRAFKQENPTLGSMFCNSCRKNVDITRLLSGWPDAASPVIHRLDRIEGKLDELLLREPHTASEAAEQLRRLFVFINDQRRQAPSTFSAICETPDGWFAKQTHYQFRVTLWCENPHGPHPVVRIGSTSHEKPISGEYLISFSKHWVTRWAPRIKWGLKVLKAAVPVGGAVLKAGLEDTLFKDVEKSLNVAEKSITALPIGDLSTNSRPAVSEGVVLSPSEHDLREFHGSMAEHFKDGRWGDLMYAELPDKSWRWMCKKCRAQLSPGPQESLGNQV